MSISTNGVGYDYIYFDAIITATQEDGLQELDIYVNTSYDLDGNGAFGVSNMASLCQHMHVLAPRAKGTRKQHRFATTVLDFLPAKRHDYNCGGPLFLFL